MLVEKAICLESSANRNQKKSIGSSPETCLVDAAARLFHKQGYGKTQFSQIARAAGLTVAQAKTYFTSPEEICHQVIDRYLDELWTQFDQLNQTGNPRQGLSLYLDDLAAKADSLITDGCPMTNLYLDVRQESEALASHAAKLLQQRLSWIRQQFIFVLQVEGPSDYPDRLTSAIHGICILAQVTGDAGLIRSQVIQLKAWIRSL